MGVSIRERAGHWVIDITHNGQRHVRSLGMRVADTETGRKEQQRVLDLIRVQKELELARGDFNIADFDAKRRPFKDYATKIAQSSKSKAYILRMVEYLAQYDTHGVSIGGVDVAFLEGFKKFLIEGAGLRQKTAHLYYSMLKLVMKRAVVDGIITVNPCDKVKGIPNCEVEKDTLTAAELSVLFNTECKGKRGDCVKRAFLFACNTGLRYSDIVSLTWGDIDSSNGEWTLHKRQVKTGKVVDSILNSTAVSLIDANDMIIHFPDDFVFEGLRGVASHTTSVLLKAWVKAAGIEKCVSWHTARRTFATLLLEAGTDVFTTQRLMGHSKIQMTSVYAKSSSEVKARAVKALDALEVGADDDDTGEGIA